MKRLNPVQREFMEQLAAIQEFSVQSALCRNGDCSLQEQLYDVTADVILSVLEIFDGYARMTSGSLSIVCEKTGKPLKQNPSIELHDAAVNYLKGAE